jgi:hypothetical protein
MARVAKQDTGRLSAITEARAKHRESIKVAQEKLKGFIEAETRDYYDQLIDSVRLALVEGHSARQIGMAYGSSDPATIRKLIEDAGVDDTSVTAQASWRSALHGDDLVVRVVAFGPDKLTGEATFSIDSDGENITATHGDFWMQSLLYREGIVKEVIDYARR